MRAFLGQICVPPLVHPPHSLCCKFWPNVGRVHPLVATLLDLVALGEDAVHRTLRREVLVLVEERVKDLGGRSVDEAGAAQLVDDGLFDLTTEGTCWL